MPSERRLFDKVLAVAVNPGAYETEAIAALRKARELVKQDPSLGHLPSAPLAKPSSQIEMSFQVTLTNVTPFWSKILLNNLSGQAYGLGLKGKMVCDFKTPATVDVRCDGSKQACKAFQEHLNLVLDHINSQLQKRRR
jgi:hypothetical protein